MNFQDITDQFSIQGKTLNDIWLENMPPTHEVFRSIFTDTIYKQGNIKVSKNPIEQILNYKKRVFLEKETIIKITNFSQNTVKVFCWNDYQLLLQINEGLTEIPVHIYLHPFGEIGKNEREYFNNGRISDYYKTVGMRYMINQHFIIYHNRYAVKNNVSLDKPLYNLPLCIIFPIFSGTSYSLFPFYQINKTKIHFIEIIEELIKKSIPYFTEQKINSEKYDVKKIAVSAFSRGGSLLRTLFSNPKSEILKKIYEVYSFDTVMDRQLTEVERKRNEGENDASYKQRIAQIVLQEKIIGVNQFWSNIKIWQGDDSDRRIRIYCAEEIVVKTIYNELRNNLRKYGGGKYQEGNFSLFNGLTIDKREYGGMSNGYELYSTDNSRILFVLPLNNFDSYIDSRNKKGIYLWEGHSWFAQSFITHALFHSGF
jgi:hypothetical protein